MKEYTNKIDNKLKLSSKVYIGETMVKGVVEEVLPPVPSGVKVNTRVGNWKQTENDGTYTTFESYYMNMPNCVDRIRLEIDNIKNFQLSFHSDGERGEDYMVIGDLDVDWSTIYNADQISADTVGVKYETRYSPSSTNWDVGMFPNDGGKHFIDIIYRKNGNNNVGQDKAWIRIKNTDLITN